MKKRPVLYNQAVRWKRKSHVFEVFSVIHRVGSGFFKVFFLLTITAMISLSFLWLYHYLLASPYMKLEQVKIEGVDGKTKDELIHTCALDADTSLLALNLKELKQKMEKHPWIRLAKLERRFPHTLTVQVEKELPRALVLMERIHYMNRWGEVFKEVFDSEEIDFPIITGVSREGSEAQEQLQKAAHLMRILESEEGLWSLNELSEIHLEKGRGMSIYFNHLAAEIRFICEDLTSKMEGLKKVVEHLSMTGRIHQVTGIDLNHVDGAVVSFRKG